MESLLPGYLETFRVLHGRDFTRFVGEHQRLWARAQETGDFVAVTRHYYDMMAPLIDAAWGPSWHFCPRLSRSETRAAATGRLYDEVVQGLGVGENAHLLDLGSGVGGTMRAIASRLGSRVTGVTLGAAEVALADAAARAAGLAERCRTVAADARSMPFDRAHFDGAYSIYAIKYFADPVQLFREVRRVLRPGARFVSYNIVRTPAYDEQDPRHRRCVAEFEFACGMPFIRSAASLIAAGDAARFRLVSSTELPGALPWHEAFTAPPLPWLMTSAATRQAVRALEALRVLPGGFAAFHETFVVGTVGRILESAELGILSGANLLVLEAVERLEDTE